MVNNEAKNLKNGISMGVINNVLNIVLPFISRTIIIQKLGTEYIGIGGLFTSIIQIISLSELGFNNAIMYAMYKPVAEHDIKKVNALLNLFRNIYRIVGCIITVISIIIAPFLPYLINGSVPKGINLYIIYFIYIINTVSSYFFFAYKRIILNVHQRYDLDVAITTAVLVMQNVLQCIFLLLTSNYYLYSILLPIATVTTNLVCSHVVREKYPEYVPKGKVAHHELMEIIKNTGGAFASKIGSTIYLSADNIVISAFLGLTILGNYQSYYYVISALIALFAAIHNTIRPILGNRLVSKDIEENWFEFKIIYFGYLWLTIIACAYCLTMFQNFETLWIGKNNVFPFIIPLFLVIYFYTTKAYALLTVYQEASGIWWHGKFVMLISALVNLIINIMLVHFIGLLGVILSSVISTVVISIPGIARVIFKYLFTEKKYINEFITMLCSLSVQFALTMIACYFSCSRISSTNVVSLITRGIITTGVALACFVVLNIRNNRFKYLMSYLKKIIKEK